MTEAATLQIETSTRYQAGSAALAFLLWGGWAWYVNRQMPTTGGASPELS